MNYTRIVSALREKLDFINDQETAEGAARRVLAILASRIDPEQARELAAELPGVDLQALQSRERNSPEEYTDALQKEFLLNLDQARQVVMTVLHEVCCGLPAETCRGIAGTVPAEMADAMRPC
ncbi:MAG TPA: DUF2267 domain-containing protein [Verrucomicrobiae bacterium]|nr:DUF2267 domain-containing protein [Verrucomicrobiae bacterium]